jgi:flavodoxin II
MTFFKPATHAPIGLFYGSSTCYTEIAGEKIRAALGEAIVDIFNINTTPIITAQLYDYIILGIPTWDYGELQEDWEEIWADLDSVDFTNKKVALYGLGDQIGYPEWFLDAMGYLHSKVVKRGATPCGYWPVAGYDYEASKALTLDGTHFVGLALDEENESAKTAERIAVWCAQIRGEFGL